MEKNKAENKDKKILIPTNDYVFKRLFGYKGNEDITRSLIKAVTGIEFEIIDLKYTPILERDLLENKMGILDVRVVANECNIIDLEMQVARNEYIADRILWYWSRLYSGSIDSGESYDETKRAICILITDFGIEKIKDIPKYHTKWNIREEKYSNVILTKKLEIHIIELSKLEKMNKLEENDKKLLAWSKFIKNPEELEDSIMSENEDIKRAKDELDKISQDEHERWLAEMREKAIMDEIALRKTGYNEGRAEGLRDGRKEGIVEGIKEGKVEIAKILLEKNMSVDEIVEITGLSKEEIEKI